MSIKINSTQRIFFRHCFTRHGILTLLLLLTAMLLLISATDVPPQIQEASKVYKQLRLIKGHFEGGKYNKDVDAYNGKKHRAMKTLAEYFGKPGTLINDITNTMGPSDLVCERVGDDLALGQGQCDASGNGAGSYLVYKWRGLHDYLWFQKTSDATTIVKCDWYFALE